MIANPLLPGFFDQGPHHRNETLELRSAKEPQRSGDLETRSDSRFPSLPLINGDTRDPLFQSQLYDRGLSEIER